MHSMGVHNIGMRIKALRRVWSSLREKWGDAVASLGRVRVLLIGGLARPGTWRGLQLAVEADGSTAPSAERAGVPAKCCKRLLSCTSRRRRIAVSAEQGRVWIAPNSGTCVDAALDSGVSPGISG